VRRRCGASPALSGLGDIAHGVQVSLAAFSVGACFYPVSYHFYFFYLAGLSVAARQAYESRTGDGLFES